MSVPASEAGAGLEMCSGAKEACSGGQRRGVSGGGGGGAARRPSAPQRRQGAAPSSAPAARAYRHNGLRLGGAQAHVGLREEMGRRVWGASSGARAGRATQCRGKTAGSHEGRLWQQGGPRHAVDGGRWPGGAREALRPRWCGVQWTESECGRQRQRCAPCSPAAAPALPAAQRDRMRWRRRDAARVVTTCPRISLRSNAGTQLPECKSCREKSWRPPRARAPLLCPRGSQRSRRRPALHAARRRRACACCRLPLLLSLHPGVARKARML